VAVFAFESRASNVLIRNVTIKKYASVAQKGAINTCWLSARRVRAKRDRVPGAVTAKLQRQKRVKRPKRFPTEARSRGLSCKKLTLFVRMFAMAFSVKVEFGLP
jgi:hypothetical protein